MDVLYPRCVGLDVHKRTVTAACRLREADGSEQVKARTFSTMTGSLLKLAEWLAQEQVTHVAMESTGEYWKPVYNLLEGCFEVWVVNSHHVKNLPGRKTDAKDAEWLSELLQHGLVRPSFIPPAPQRDLRELTRCRTNFVRERVNVCNRIQKMLESANIKLASVASDVLGVSGRAMLNALVAGQENPAALAQLSRGRMRKKKEELEEALCGRMRAHHRIMLREMLRQIDSLDESIARLEQAILEYCAPFEEAIALADTIPGIARPTAEALISEVGADMSRFPTAGHLCAWAGIAPGNHESAGKRLSGRIRQGNHALRNALVQAAHAAARSRGTYLSAQFHRIAARRGKKRAVFAVAHSILRALYYMLSRRQEYKDLGDDYFDKRKPERTTHQLVNRLKSLGYDVSIKPKEVAAAA